LLLPTAYRLLLTAWLLNVRFHFLAARARPAFLSRLLPLNGFPLNPASTPADSGASKSSGTCVASDCHRWRPTSVSQAMESF